MIARWAGAKVKLFVTPRWRCTRRSARGVDVMLDDRDSRPGVMFAEWELIGVPCA